MDGANCLSYNKHRLASGAGCGHPQTHKFCRKTNSRLSFVPLPVPVSLQTASHKAPGLAEIRRQKEDDREEEMAGCDGAKSSASMEEEEACVEKKYGGIAPKKPLISKDHERAYFDSADWVLGKQAANSTTRAAVESLKPKLKRTPHHQLPPRKPTCASS